MHRACILLAVLCSIAGLSYGQQSYTISGQITDHKGRPLEETVLQIQGQIRFCDAKGRFSFGPMPSGKYVLAIHRIGYMEQADTLQLDRDLNLSYQMEPDESQQLAEVVIEGHREEVLATQAVSVLEGSELDRKKSQTLSDALEGIAGLSSIKNGASIAKPVIHGMHSNRVLIMNNGIRQEGQQWGLEHAPEIDPFLAEKLTVVKGAAGVQYGSDAIAGVVLVEPADLPDSSGIHGKVYSTYMSNGRQQVLSGSVQGSPAALPGFAWRLQGTGKRAGNRETPDYFIDNTGVRELNFSATAGYKKGETEAELFYSRFSSRVGIFSGSHIGNLTDLERAIAAEQPLQADNYGFSYDIDRPYQQIAHNLFAAKLKFRLDGIGELHTKYGYQLNHREEFDLVRRSISEDGKPQLDFELRTHTLDLHLDHKNFGKLRGSIGASGIMKSNVYEGRQLIPNFRQYNMGLFVLEHYIEERYELEAGLRYDYQYIETFRFENGGVVQEDFDYQNLSAALGGMWRVTDQNEFRLSASSAFRAPNVNELFSDGVHQGVSSYELGDRTLKPEVAYNLSLSWLHQSERLSTELSIYNNYISNFIYLEPQFPETILTIRGAFPLFAYQQVNARFRGVDASINYQLAEDWNWSAKGNIVRASNTDTDEWLVLIPADQASTQIRWSGFRRKAMTGYLLAGISYTAEQTRFPENTDFAPPPPAYTLVQAEAGIDWTVNKQVLSLSIGAENLGNVRYRSYLNRFRYFTDEPGQNWILRLNYQF